MPSSSQDLTLHGQSPAGAPFQSPVVCHEPRTLSSPLPPAPRGSYGEACVSPAEPHLRLGLIPLPFLDFRKELVDFRKMLKKRWAWACPGAEGAVWRPRHCCQPGALAAAPSAGRGVGLLLAVGLLGALPLGASAKLCVLE